jgi:trehalose 6-phosphate synthase
VGFHVALYRDNFVEAARLLAGARPEERVGNSVRLHHGGGRTAALAVPIGIDVDAFEELARLPRVERRAERLRQLHGRRRLLVSADRLDYTKGIRERLLAFDRFLEGNPHLAGRVDLLQIVVPSRYQVAEYRTMKQDIDREVGRINGQWARDGWVPIHYRYDALDRDELVAHYQAADVVLVTPLRDGMNLVASEFAAARVDEDGVLLVSEFAGIAERSPGAVLVNPYDVEGTASAISKALDMDREERRERMRTLRARVRGNPVSRWAARCLGEEAELDGAASRGPGIDAMVRGELT